MGQAPTPSEPHPVPTSPISKRALLARSLLPVCPLWGGPNPVVTAGAEMAATTGRGRRMPHEGDGNRGRPFSARGARSTPGFTHHATKRQSHQTKDQILNVARATAPRRRVCVIRRRFAVQTRSREKAGRDDASTGHACALGDAPGNLRLRQRPLHSSRCSKRRPCRRRHWRGSRCRHRRRGRYRGPRRQPGRGGRRRLKQLPQFGALALTFAPR
jgi:hypothetical protein